jgi:hypothetical protein
MKAKSIVPEKGERLESLKVEPSKQPVAQANDEDLGIDLREFPALHEVNDVLEQLCRTDPSAIECEDQSLMAYKRSSALLAYANYAAVGLDAEGSEFTEPIAGLVMDSIQLQLDIVRLASKRLFSLCQAKDRAEVQPAKTA